MSWPILLAFACGFLAIGIGIGILIYWANLAWFLSRMSIESLRDTIEETAGKYQARWAREVKRKKRLNLKASGRHLAGTPLRENAADEVRKEFKEVKPSNESRRL